MDCGFTGQGYTWEGQGTEQVRLKVEGALAEVTPQRYQYCLN